MASNRARGWALAIGIAAAYQAAPASATGIPVYCYNCQDASFNAAHSIIDAIRSQTEALLNGMDYVMRTEKTLDMISKQADQKIANAKALEPSLGAKPRSACGQSAAAGLRSATASASSKTVALLNKAAAGYNNQTRGLAPTESRREYVIRNIMERMDQPTYDAAKLVMQNEPISAANASGYQQQLTDTLMATNPFPVEMPSAEQIERIKKSGSQGERESLARQIALVKRQQVAQYPIMRAFEANTQRITPEGIQYLIDDIKPYLSDEDKAKLAGKISPNQLDELLATYRVRSPRWTKAMTATPSPEAVAKESMLIAAEQLNQTFQSKRLLDDILRMLSMTEGRTASQAGLTSQ